MPSITDDALDAALAVAPGAATRLDICSQEPTSRAEATTTYSLGNKTSPTIGAAGDATPNGRKRTVGAVTDGTVTSSGTATHWALTDSTRLLATSTLSASQVVTSGNTFTLTAFDIRMPDVA